MGWTVPTSLLASITLASTVSGRSAARELVRVDAAGGVAAEVGDFEAELLQVLGGVDAGMVLDRGGDDVVAGAGAAHGVGDAEERAS